LKAMSMCAPQYRCGTCPQHLKEKRSMHRQSPAVISTGRQLYLQVCGGYQD
jgi:hypothetical protein